MAVVAFLFVISLSYVPVPCSSHPSRLIDPAAAAADRVISRFK
jgi:hypothetical protein